MENLKDSKGLKVVNLLFALGNIFYVPFVVYKVYGWFYTEVGFELPELSYWHIFALKILLGIFNPNYMLGLKIDALQEKEDYVNMKPIFVTAGFSIVLFIDWLVKVLIYS